ncbi:hypothetical protein TNCV_3471901 [Trichonephila clavipes]|nr:hypothetical protein TNCV_3471901 [Trichonephila clavipes]
MQTPKPQDQKICLKPTCRFLVRMEVDILESSMVSGEIGTLPDLKASIIRQVAKMFRDFLHATIENVINHFQHVIDVNGAHIDLIV